MNFNYTHAAVYTKYQQRWYEKIDKYIYIYIYNISENLYLHFKERLYFIQASMINNQHAQLLLNFI
jgi:hypothetical protein